MKELEICLLHKWFLVSHKWLEKNPENLNLIGEAENTGISRESHFCK